MLDDLLEGEDMSRSTNEWKSSFVKAQQAFAAKESSAESEENRFLLQGDSFDRFLFFKTKFSLHQCLSIFKFFLERWLKFQTCLIAIE